MVKPLTKVRDPFRVNSAKEYWTVPLKFFYPFEKLSCDLWITMAPGTEEAVATLNERHVPHPSLRLNLTQNKISYRLGVLNSK